MQFEHHGHTVTVNPDSFVFTVSGPQFEDGKSQYDAIFRSAEQAKDEIEKRIAAAEKQAVATRRVSLPALDATTAEAITIRGVNRTDSTVLGAKDAEGLPFDFFPRVAWIERALLVRKDLKKRMAAIDAQLGPFGMRANVGYGRIAPYRYDAKTAGLEAEFSRKAQAAIAAEPKPDEAQTGRQI